MPTYDYVCDGCGHAYELFQSMTDGVKKTCPKCGKKKLRRLIGAGGAIVFKGSGFYQTDYKNSGQTSTETKGDGGGCAPSCGTPDAPSGCKMGKKS